MKTPEKIKKSILECLGFHSDCEDVCDACPYWDEGPFCKGALCRDIIACIDQMEERISLNTLRDAIYLDAVAHGLWESTDYTVECCMERAKLFGFPFNRDVNLRAWAAEVVHREANELEQAEEADEYAEELADVIIASLSVAGKLGIDIDAAVRRKMAINKGRPWKHGKEAEHETRKSV